MGIEKSNPVFAKMSILNVEYQSQNSISQVSLYLVIKTFDTKFRILKNENLRVNRSYMDHQKILPRNTNCIHLSVVPSIS